MNPTAKAGKATAPVLAVADVLPDAKLIVPAAVMVVKAVLLELRHSCNEAVCEATALTKNVVTEVDLAKTLIVLIVSIYEPEVLGLSKYLNRAAAAVPLGDDKSPALVTCSSTVPALFCHSWRLAV